MFRPTKLLLSWCLAAVMVAPAALSCGQAPLATRETVAEAPAGGLLDEGNVFNADEEVLMSEELEEFRHRVGLPAFVVTVNYTFDETVDQYGERLVTAWSKGKPCLVLLYERGSARLNFSATPGALGRMEDMKTLFLSASRTAALTPGDASAAQRLRAALRSLTLSAGNWRETGALPDAIPAPDLASPPVLPPAKAETIPAAPVDFVMDDAHAFEPKEEAAFKTSLMTFHSNHGIAVYVATFSFLPDTSAQLWAERLSREWLKERPGAVLVMNRGTGENEQWLGIAGSALNERLPASTVLFRAMEEARQTAQASPAAPGASLAQGVRIAADHLMKAFTTGDPPGSRGKAAGPGRVIAGLAAALVVGMALLFLFHRVQERLERRTSEQWFFPDVNVGRRLGASQGGGQVAGISFGRETEP